MLYTVPMSIGDRIRTARDIKKISQKVLGDALNITDSAVSQWERGETYPEIHKIPSIAKALGVRVAFLMEDATDLGELERAILLLDPLRDRDRKRALRMLQTFVEDLAE